LSSRAAARLCTLTNIDSRTVTTRTWQALKPENIYGQEKLCSKNSTHDCRCGQISPRTKDCAKGRNRRSDYCRCRCRSCGGHEVKGRLGRPDAENRGETAVWKKQNEEGPDVAKEKDARLKHQSLSDALPRSQPSGLVDRDLSRPAELAQLQKNCQSYSGKASAFVYRRTSRRSVGGAACVRLLLPKLHHRFDVGDARGNHSGMCRFRWCCRSPFANFEYRQCVECSPTRAARPARVAALLICPFESRTVPTEQRGRAILHRQATDLPRPPLAPLVSCST
jgi:hypothetical protein